MAGVDPFIKNAASSEPAPDRVDTDDAAPLVIGADTDAPETKETEDEPTDG